MKKDINVYSKLSEKAHKYLPNLQKDVFDSS